MHICACYFSQSNRCPNHEHILQLETAVLTCTCKYNNWPVSLLPALSKICERAALNQLTEYTTRQNCLTEHQNGNKKKHSTETLHIFMSDMILDTSYFYVGYDSRSNGSETSHSVGSVGLVKGF